MPLQAEELLKLQDLDLRLDALAREKAALDNGAGLKAQLDQYAAALADAEGRLHHAQAEQQNAELEQQGVEAKTATVRKRLYEGRVTNPKELTAMEQEIEMFGRQRGRLDERILVLMEEIETTTAELERLHGERDAVRAAWEAQVARYRKDAGRIAAELGRLVPERQAIAEQIEAATLRRYEDLRRRLGGVAAVRIESGICGGCRVSVPAARQREAASAGRYVTCENCARLLFPPA